MYEKKDYRIGPAAFLWNRIGAPPFLAKHRIWPPAFLQEPNTAQAGEIPHSLAAVRIFYCCLMPESKLSAWAQ